MMKFDLKNRGNIVAGMVWALLVASIATALPGCGSGSNEAVAPKEFAPPPPSDTPAGTKGAKATESVQG
jgi:hypothetical protein